MFCTYEHFKGHRNKDTATMNVTMLSQTTTVYTDYTEVETCLLLEDGSTQTIEYVTERIPHADTFDVGDTSYPPPLY
jgi:hypothetical protein